MIDTLSEMGMSPGHNRCPLHNSVTIFHPDMFKIVAMEKCEQEGIHVLLHCELVDVTVTDKRITNVTVMGKGIRINIEANVFIDGTGDGDLAYLAGCSYEKGQEDLGVMQPPTLMFSLNGFDEEKFFKYLDEHPEDLQPAEFYAGFTRI